MKRKRKLHQIIGMIAIIGLLANSSLALQFLGSTDSVLAGPIYSEDPVFGYHYFVGFHIDSGDTVSIGYFGPLPMDDPELRWTVPGPPVDALRLFALTDFTDPALGDKLNWLDALETGNLQEAFGNLRWAPGYEPNGTDYAELARTIMSPTPNADALPQDLSNLAKGGDPVLLSNGEYTLSVTDLIVPGRVLSVGLTRSYGSRRSYNARFGYGWDVNYNLKLRRLSDPNVIVLLDGQGNQHDYVRDSQDPQRFYRSNKLSSFLQESNGQLTLHTKSGITYHFDAHGNLARIVDQNGNQLTFSYDSAGLLPIYGHNPTFLPPDLGGPVGKHGLIAMEYQLNSITDDLGRNIDFSYDTNGLLSEVADFTGRRWTYAYDPNTNDLLTVTDPNGLYTRYTYDFQHNILDVIDPNGQVYTLNTYDMNDQITHQTYGQGTFVFDYLPDANQTWVTDREGHRTATLLNHAGQVIAETTYTDDPQQDPNAYTVRYAYNEHQSVSRVLLPRGNCTDFTYDSLGNVTGIFRKASPADPNDAGDPAVLATLYSYDPQHVFKVKTITDPLGNTSTFDYDANGNLIRTILPTVGHETPIVQYTYNAHGQLDTAIAPDGIVTKYVYYTDPTDPNNYGRLYQTVADFGTEPNSLNITSTLSYDELGRVLQITDPNGDSARFAYDENGQLVQTRNAHGYNTYMGYTRNKKLDWIYSQINDVNQVTSYTYDLLDQVKSVTDPLGYVTRLGYTQNEDPNLVTDAEGNRTESIYDERGLLARVFDANDGVTNYVYDENANLIEIIDAKGNATSYSYDSLDRLIRTRYADQSTELIQYDKNGSITASTNRQGQTITYEYDALNRLVHKTRPQESPIGYSYDITGRVTDVNDGTLHTAYSYDRLGRVTSVQDHAQRQVAYEYDQRGLRTRLSYPGKGSNPPRRKLNRAIKQIRTQLRRRLKHIRNPQLRKKLRQHAKAKIKKLIERWKDKQTEAGLTLDYSYDALGRIHRIISDNNDVLAAYQYDDLSRRTQLTLGNGSLVVYEYDLNNRLTRLTNHVSPTETINFDYAEYDRVGNRLSCQIDDNPTQQYLYDNLYQLVYVDYNEFEATRYHYDDLGMRTAVNDGQITYYTSNNLNQYTTVDSSPFSYDLNGNLTHTGQYIYYYDCENRLTDVNDHADLPIASFKYDTQGRRIEKTVYGSPNQITRYLYDGDQVSAEYDDNDTLLRRFIYGPGIDEPILMIDVAGGNEAYYYHFDGLGSVVALSNTNSEIVERYTYDVFGAPTIEDANGVRSSQSAVGNPYLFTARRFDSDTGLYYYRARYYAHDIGRFLQTDPIGYSDGINWYGYCGNNPVGMVDPWGLCKDSYMPTAGDFFAGWASGIPGTFTGMGYGLLDVGSGLYNTFRHPILSIGSAGRGIGQAMAHPIQAVKGVGHGIYGAGVTLIGDDREASGRIIGRTAGSAAVSAVGAKVVRAGINRVRGIRSRNIGYHATRPHAADSIMRDGFRLGSEPGRLGSHGVYVNSTLEGAVAEFQFHNPGITPKILKVNYSPGVNAVASVAPGSYVSRLPLNVNSISAPSLRAPGTINTNVLNGSVRPIGIMP
jgi:RHS repeat-associated protein